MSKAEVGDLVTVTNPEKTSLRLGLKGASAYVVQVHDDKLWVNAAELDPGWDLTDRLYIRHGCYEIHPLSRSPLMEALK